MPGTAAVVTVALVLVVVVLVLHPPLVETSSDGGSDAGPSLHAT